MRLVRVVVGSVAVAGLLGSMAVVDAAVAKSPSSGAQSGSLGPALVRAAQHRLDAESGSITNARPTGPVLGGRPSDRMAAAALPSSAAASGSGMVGAFVGLSPARLLDTRSGATTVDGQSAGGGAVGAGATRAVAIAGRGGVPASATAVVVNLTEAHATASGYLTVFPGGARPNTSSINFTSGATTAVQATLKVGSAGQVDIYNRAGQTDVVLDVVGYYMGSGDTSAGAVYNPQTPRRLLDTRTGQALPAHFYLAVHLSIPQTMAVALNVTAIGPKSAGYLSVWPGSGPNPPKTSAVNFASGQTVANMAITQTLTDNGAPAFSVGNQSNGPVNIVVDVVGFYTPVSDGGGTVFVPVVPKRIIDTRVPLGLPGTMGPRQRAAANTGSVGDARTAAIVANVVGINPSASTYLTLNSGDAATPATSNLNLAAHATRSNMAITSVGTESTRPIAVYNAAGETDLALDAVGYFEDAIPPSTTVGLASSTASTTYDSPVTLTATLDPAATGSVAFGDAANSTVLGVAPVVNGVATFTTSALAVGSRSIEAAYSGNSSHAAGVSSTVPVTVADGPTSLATAFQNDSRHDGSDAADTFDPATLHQAWSVPLPSADSPATQMSYPLIAAGRVFVMAGNVLYALDGTSGSVDWSTTLSGSWYGITYDGGQVFVQMSSGQLSAYNAGTGHQNWSVSAPGQYSFSSPPTAYDGVVYTAGAGSGGTLYAFREADGALNWSASVTNGDVSSPAVDDSGVYTDYACNLTTAMGLDGTVRWNRMFSCEGGGGATSVLHGGDLYLRGGNPTGAALILAASDGSTAGTFGGTSLPAFDGSSMYVPNGGSLTAVDPSGSPNKWTFVGDGSIDTTPVTTNGIVFAGSSNGHVYAVNSATGAQVWTATVPGVIQTTDGFSTHAGIGAAAGMLIVPAGGYVTAFTN